MEWLFNDMSFFYYQRNEQINLTPGDFYMRLRNIVNYETKKLRPSEVETFKIIANLYIRSQVEKFEIPNDLI
jgi:hypothetical protein